MGAKCPNQQSSTNLPAWGARSKYQSHPMAVTNGSKYRGERGNTFLTGSFRNEFGFEALTDGSITVGIFKKCS